jgi:hypothetical protein
MLDIQSHHSNKYRYQISVCDSSPFHFIFEVKSVYQFSKYRQLSPSNPALFIFLNRPRCNRTSNALRASISAIYRLDVGKVVEKIHLSRNENRILSVQNKMQKGRGEIPSIVGLILTELIIEAIKRKSSLYKRLCKFWTSFSTINLLS